MDLETYAIEARKTQAFNPIYHVTYPALGLCDEVAEFVEKDRLLYPQINSLELAKEAGDVFWYFNCICDYSNLSITDFFKYETVSDLLDLMIIAGKIAGVAKKAARDNNGYVDTDKMRPLLEQFSAAFLNILSMCLPNYTLEEIMDLNIAKLRDRQSRNVIRGEGDNR